MPSAQELKRKKTKSGLKMPISKTGPIRRPARGQTVVVEAVAVEFTDSGASVEEVETEQSPSDVRINLESSSETDKDVKKSRKLQLPNIFGFAIGKQLLKSKFPKSFGIAEKVVNDWLDNGDFKEIPIETPLVQFYIGEGLRRAKEVEKKIESRLDNAGVLPIVRHQMGRAQKWINKK